MEIKDICDELLDIYENKTEESDARSRCVLLISKLQSEVYQNSLTSESLNHILNLTINISSSTQRKLKQVLEKKLLTFLAFLPDLLWEEKENLNRQDKKSDDSKMALSLIKAAQEIYEIKIPRDAFSGKRRGLSIQILEMLAIYFEVPEFIVLCQKSLKNKSKNEFLDVIESLKGYYLQTNQMPSKKIITELNQHIEKTKHKGEAVGALLLQVETGTITELEALLTINNWKEKNK